MYHSYYTTKSATVTLVFVGTILKKGLNIQILNEIMSGQIPAALRNTSNTCNIFLLHNMIFVYKFMTL